MRAAPYDYDEFERRVALRATRARRRLRGLQGLAAGVVLACGGLLGWSLRDGGEAIDAPIVAVGSAPADALLGQADLQAVSATEWRVEGGTAFAAAALEDRIAQLDDAMSIATIEGAPLNQIHVLDAERARLVDSLVQVRAAERLLVVSR